ncbi:MAG TPA: glutathione S-transferase C-terminal domain-containing protein [Ilumatobacter sp.]|nr:glutathione S-transferase C-terminal domain-containing protein [Ilumatobacter sp.]
METAEPFILYGAPASLYSGKARSYLRKQRIDFVERSPGGDRYLQHVVPVIGRWIIPVLETPDGELVQDTADIILYFERGDGRTHRRFSVYPDTPLQRAVSHVFELFGGEGLLRPAMHYRWNFDDENLDFLRSEFPLMAAPPEVADDAERRFDGMSRRMRKACRGFGVSDQSAPLVEAAFQEWLDLFSAHLAEHPYLLGGRPTIGDFGLMAAMWAHLFRDPAPQHLIKRRAPRVGRWVERMSTGDPYEHEHEYDGRRGDLVGDDAVPPTVLAMMRHVADEWLPEIAAHVGFANDWLAAHPELVTGTNGLADPGERVLGECEFAWRGVHITTRVLPYRFWLLQHLHDDLAEAGTADQQRVRAVFAQAGLEALLDLRTDRRVERVGNLEVWGPPTDGR